MTQQLARYYLIAFSHHDRVLPKVTNLAEFVVAVVDYYIITPALLPIYNRGGIIGD